MEINHFGHQYFGNLVLSPKMAVFETKREEDQEKDYVYVRHTPVSLNLWKDPKRIVKFFQIVQRVRPLKTKLLVVSKLTLTPPL